MNPLRKKFHISSLASKEWGLEKVISKVESNNLFSKTEELSVFFESIYSRKDAQPLKKSVDDNNILISKSSTGKLNTISGYVSK